MGRNVHRIEYICLNNCVYAYRKYMCCFFALICMARSDNNVNTIADVLISYNISQES